MQLDLSVLAGNPILKPLNRLNGLPDFNEIKPEHVEPALDYILEANRKQIDRLLRQKVQPTWENFMVPLEDMSDWLDRVWSPISHLNSVKDSDALRSAYENCLPKLSDYASEIGQNEDLYEKFLELKSSDPFQRYSVARQKSIDNELRDFKLSGIGLEEDKRARYREITKTLSDLTNQFSQNVLDATDGWDLHVTESDRLEGLPETVLQTARVNAERKDKTGWLFSLQAPSYIPVMTYCNDRQIREEMYRAYVTRASEVGPNAGQWDNSELICEIIELRTELAQLLGFSNYAEYSLETKMATDADEVERFLQELAEKSRCSALNEIAELEVFAKNHCELENLEPWDMAWVSERLKVDRYDFSEEQLRPYFPLPTVLKGMFDVVSRLFGISVVEAEVENRWDPAVQAFSVYASNGDLYGQFYVDLFAREHKRGGAWMADCVGRRKVCDDLQTPVAFLTCNFPSPINGKPALLSHDEVMTLFHEFGHSLHHLLTQINEPMVAGINGVPWDAVELPSQFLENWCWEKPALALFSGHYETAEPIPDELYEKMQRSRNFQSAMQMLRQIEFSLFDLEIHRLDQACNAPEVVRKTLSKIRKQVAVVDVPDFNRFENGFGHIFAGGYAAGYYSYKWAEVLSADAYGRFEEEGVFNEQAGKDFLSCILERGGSADPMDLFVQFRGRKPSVDALLRHSGLA